MTFVRRVYVELGVPCLRFLKARITNGMVRRLYQASS